MGVMDVEAAEYGGDLVAAAGTQDAAVVERALSYVLS